MQNPPPDAIARANSQAALAASEDVAQYLGYLPRDAWNSPTGCSEWNIRQLAIHIAAANQMFSTVVGSIVEGNELPPFGEIFSGAMQRLEPLEGGKIGEDIAEKAQQIQSHFAKATESQLQQTVTFPFGDVPVWLISMLTLQEDAVHNWDSKVGRDPEATIRAEWATLLGRALVEGVPRMAGGAAEAPGTYLLQVGDGIGPVTVNAKEGQSTSENAAVGQPDVTVDLTADQFVRLLWGRLPLAEPIQAGKIAVVGEAGTAARLNTVFKGI
jgi:uncharacterized protein (TIGR03083 family)